MWHYTILSLFFAGGFYNVVFQKLLKSADVLQHNLKKLKWHFLKKHDVYYTARCIAHYGKLISAVEHHLPFGITQ